MVKAKKTKNEDLTPFASTSLIWALIQAADTPHMSSSLRAGMPDEPLYTFSLEGPTCSYHVKLWEGEVREQEALRSLIEKLAELVRKYTGEEPVL